MPRRPCLFRERDVTRAIKAVIAAGPDVARAEIEKDGRIVVVPGRPPDDVPNGACNSVTRLSDDLDRELAEFETRHGES